MDTSVRETMARESLRIRALRTRYFPHDIFDEYAWVLLLDAYLHHIGADSGIRGAMAPPLDSQIMRHWRRYLEQQKLIEAGDVAAAPPSLTATGLAQMEHYLDEMAQVVTDLP